MSVAGPPLPRLAQALDALRALALGDRLLTEPAALAAFDSDGLTAFQSRAAAVVFAQSTREVADVVAVCHEHAVPFVARGSGTSLSGGSMPVRDGVVIALNRMNRVLGTDPTARTATVQPGTINLAVTGAAVGHGLVYAPDPSSQSVCTIGGNVAFNSGGAHCLKYGMTSNHVLGLTVVLPDGSVERLGGDSSEFVGPDWTGLFCGCEGLFGIVTEVTLRLIPAPEDTFTALAAYPSLEAAGAVVARILADGLLPVAMEIMDALTLEAAEAAVQPGYPRDAALLIVELDGERDVVAADAVRLGELLADSAASEVRTTRDAQERAVIWRGRKSAFSAVGWLAPDFLVQDGVVPRTRLAEALAAIDVLSAKHGIRVANVFHAGDGNLHPLILFDGREPGALEAAEALAGEILRLCIDLGGSVTGEHGIGMEKRDYLPLMFAPGDMDLMVRLRQAVDPGELANRGKMLIVGAAEPTAVPAAAA